MIDVEKFLTWHHKVRPVFLALGVILAFSMLLGRCESTLKLNSSHFQQDCAEFLTYRTQNSNDTTLLTFINAQHRLYIFKYDPRYHSHLNLFAARLEKGKKYCFHYQNLIYKSDANAVLKTLKRLPE